MVNKYFGANLKKHVFLQNFAENFLFFQLFCTKYAENDYFDQRLECAAPKRWSKYTTIVQNSCIYIVIWQTSIFIPTRLVPSKRKANPRELKVQGTKCGYLKDNWMVKRGTTKVQRPQYRVSTFIVGCRGASQLGGSLLGIQPGYKANKL